MTSEASDATTIESTSQQREISVVAIRSAQRYDKIDTTIKIYNVAVNLVRHCGKMAPQQ